MPRKFDRYPFGCPSDTAGPGGVSPLADGTRKDGSFPFSGADDDAAGGMLVRCSTCCTAGDGVFDIAVLAGAPGSRLTPLLKRLRDGQAAEELRLLRSSRLTATPVMETGRPVWVETDGEAIGVLPASFQIAPRVLRLRA